MAVKKYKKHSLNAYFIIDNTQYFRMSANSLKSKIRHSIKALNIKLNYSGQVLNIMTK